jgi:hypothetical protein
LAIPFYELLSKFSSLALMPTKAEGDGGSGEETAAPATLFANDVARHVVREQRGSPCATKRELYFDVARRKAPSPETAFPNAVKEGCIHKPILNPSLVREGLERVFERCF